jgi:murein endopeptidase
MRRLLTVVMFLACLAAPAVQAAVPVSLKGSPESMVRQSDVAKRAGYPLVETYQELRERVAKGELVPLLGNEDYTFREGRRSGVARVEMRLFIERLAAQYHEATGERLVVTSLTRPKSRQPSNSHALSVHPAGIAVDLRVSARKASRQWLESALLALERQGLLDVTRERWPPHYHVALFPEPYLTHVERLIGPEALAAALAEEPLEAELPSPDRTVLSDARSEVTAPTLAAPTPTEKSGLDAWALLWALPAVVLAVGLLRRRRRS